MFFFFFGLEMIPKFKNLRIQKFKNLIPILTLNLFSFLFFSSLGPTQVVYTFPSQSTFAGSDQFHVESTRLRPVLHSARVRKTPGEIAYMRAASSVSIAAHERILNDLAILHGLKEFNIEAFFLFFIQVCKFYLFIVYLFYYYLLLYQTLRN